MSYSYANGFGAGVSIGTDNKTQLGGSIGLNYNAKSGSWGATAGLKVGLGGTDSQGNYSNWVDAGVHVNNIGRESQSQGVSANIRGQYNEKKGLNGSLGLSYDTASGYGATIGLTSSFGPVSVTPSWTVSEYGGLSSDVQYGFDRNLFNRTNNPDHSAANRNLLSDIFDGLSGLVSGVGRAWDGMAGAVGGLNGENLSNGWNAIKNALFGGGDDATLKPGPRPGTYVDEDGTVLVRDPKTGNLVIEGSLGNLVLVDSRGLSNPDYQQAVDKIHGELYPQQEGLGESVVKGFVDQLTGVLKKLLSPVVKTGMDAMNNIQEISGKLGDVSESMQLTKPLVEDTIQLLYKEMDAERQIWRNKNDAIVDQLAVLQSDPKQTEESLEQIRNLWKDQADGETKLKDTLDSLDSKVGSLISLASDLNAGKTTNLNAAYSQIYEGLMRVNSPELSGKSQSVRNLANTTQNFLISYFSYKMTGMAGTVNETGSAGAFKDSAEQQRQGLRNLWTRYLRESTRNNERPYVNPIF
ncbi:hypothetical protein LEP1GSC128_0007 [Leptospira borgpetersenii str. 200801926]|uniref:Large structural domain protein n=1 Tax=Leptospira borgpetersenii str. 200801926 TaxID=1193009 RepID=A0ABN0I3A9_LEPBO|nr:hypothetical protein LEP1GSC128_0007 [Leptospira borgpetersenii str. 200801926]